MAKGKKGISDSDNLPEDIEIVETSDSDGLQNFIDGTTEDERIELIRREPKVFRNVEIDGYLDDLKHFDGKDTIKREYGGGRYQLLKRSRSSGKVLGSVMFKISGPPRLPRDDGQESRSGVPTIDVGGVDVPVHDTDLIMRMLLFKRFVDVALPAPVSINEQILLHLLEKGQAVNNPDPFETFQKVSESLSMLKGDDVGGDWPSVIGKALDSVGKLVSTRPQVIQQPGQATSKDVSQMNEKEIAGVLIQTIVKNYRLDKPPERVVSQLKMFVDPDEEQKKRFKALYQVAFDLAESELVDLFDEKDDTDPGGSAREEFVKYFDKIFELYVGSVPDHG